MIRKFAAFLGVSALSVSVMIGPSYANELVNDRGVRVTTNGTNQIEVFTQQKLWGKPMTVEFVSQDQDARVLKTVTPTRQSPSFVVRGLKNTEQYRIDSPGLNRPIMFRLAVLSDVSTAKNVDTKPSPPQGKTVVKTLVGGPGNASWYVSPYFFPEVAQTVRVDRASTIDAVAVLFAPSVTTLLTPQGVQLMKNPSTIDWSDPKTQGIEIFNNDPGYSFPATVTVRLYSGVQNPLAQTIDPATLKEIAASTKKVRISHNGYLTMPLPETDLAPGDYLVTIAFSDVPKNVLTIFLRGSNFGGPKNKVDAYPQGQAYQVRDPAEGGYAFNRATTKRQPVSAVGQDVLDPGDLLVILLKRGR